MPFCWIDTFDGRSFAFSSLSLSFVLLLKKTQHCLSYPIYEPLPIIHTIVMFVLSLYDSFILGNGWHSLLLAMFM
jgi:hypothetical protein